MDLTSLKIFTRVAEYGSLSKASERSNLALAAVSRRIVLLEQQYDVQLFVRNGRGVTLTEAGHVFLRHAHDILQRINGLGAEMDGFSHGLRGAIRVHASTAAIAQFLPSDLARFGDRFPDLRVDVREGVSPLIARAVREGQAEIGVIVADGDQAELDVADYRRYRLAIVGTADRLGSRTSARFADLASHDFVTMEDNTATVALLRSIAAREGFFLRLRAQVGSFDAMCRMVQSGFGLGVLPEESARNFVSSLDLKMIAIEDDWAERRMIICTSPTRKLSIGARRVKEFLIDASKDMTN